MSNLDSGQPDLRALRAALWKMREALDEALTALDGNDRGDDQAAEALEPARQASAASFSVYAMPSAEPPMSLEDLDSVVLDEVIRSLPPVFDTYHVVEHPTFRAAHSELLERPAVNQLTGKALRRLAPALGIAYIGQRGRRRSALWQRQRLGR